MWRRPVPRAGGGEDDNGGGYSCRCGSFPLCGVSKRMTAITKDKVLELNEACSGGTTSGASSGTCGHVWSRSSTMPTVAERRAHI